MRAVRSRVDSIGVREGPSCRNRKLDGDREAYSEIVADYQDMLLAYAAFRVPDAALVDEVVQQTFIRAYEQLRDFQTDKDFGVWLRSICSFMILAELKRATRDRHNRDNYQEHLKVRLLGQALERGESTADEELPAIAVTTATATVTAPASATAILSGSRVSAKNTATPAATPVTPLS